MKINHSRILFFGLLTTFFLQVTGCSEGRCETCGDCPSGVELESNSICEDDFNTAADYEAAIELTESYGCACN